MIESNSEKIETVVSLFNEAYTHVSSNRALPELRLLIERILFTPEVRDIFADQKAGTSSVLTLCDSIVTPDVSPEAVEFMHKSVQKNMQLLLLQESEQIIAEIEASFTKSREIRVVTAVKLPIEFKDRIEDFLQEQFLGQTRFIFNEDPGLVAGCVIEDGNNRHDLSLQTAGFSLLHEYFDREFMPL